MYVTDGFKDNVSAEAVNPDDLSVLDGVRGTAPAAAPADGEPTFLDRLEAFAPGTPTIFSGHFYDCVNVWRWHRSPLAAPIRPTSSAR